MPRTDGTNYSHQASVDPDLCISCGICVGACPTATPFRSRGALVPGIDLPDHSASTLREEIVAGGLGNGDQQAMVFACRSDQQTVELEKAGINVVKVACMGQLPPSYVDFALSRGHATGVMLLGCGEGNCSYRFGAEWTAQRMTRQRDPMVRTRVDMSRVAIGWQAPWSDALNAVGKYERFLRSLEQ